MMFDFADYVVDSGQDVVIPDDTTLIVDTMVVHEGGSLTIGTADNPAENVTVVFKNSGAITDPDRIGRGLINHGSLVIHGKPKARRARVTVTPMTGATSIVFASLPEGWAVGDKIVIAGTTRLENQPAQDEIRYISSIDGNVVSFDNPLVFNHIAPRPDLKTWVANYSSSVTFKAEAGNSTPLQERPHFISMHSALCDVRYASFEHMGRTDKSKEFDSINVPGRYPIHIHRAGVQEDPAMIIGNAVWTSPGWGITHHDSAAIINENAVYGSFGSGIVAESGNETGSWDDNIVIWAEGLHWKSEKLINDSNDPSFNMFRGGSGYGFQGRLVKATGNVAASVNTGFAYSHRGFFGDGKRMNVDSTTFDFPEALHWDPDIDPNGFPILVSHNNEVFAAREGMLVFKANPNQRHDIHSHIKNFKAWNVEVGIDLQYTAHYLVENPDLIAGQEVGIGITLGNNLTDITIVNPSVIGFVPSVRAAKTSTFPTPADWGLRLVGGTFDSAVEGFEANEQIPELLDNTFDITLPTLTYHDRNEVGGRQIWIEGTKTDSVGTVTLPVGSDEYRVKYQSVLRLLTRDGWWDLDDGRRVLILVAYYSDRGNGNLYKTHHLVEIEDDVKLGSYPYNGILDLSTFDTSLELVVENTPDPIPEPEPEPEPEPDPDPEPPCDCTLCDEEKAALQAQVNALTASVAALESENNTLTSQVAFLTTEVTDLNVTANALQERVDVLTNGILSARTTLINTLEGN